MEKPSTDAREEGSLRAHLRTLLIGRFDMIIGILIIANTVIMFLQLELEGHRAEALLGRDAGESSQTSRFVFNVAAHVFTAAFLLELLLRLYVFRCAYFRSAFNVLDFAIVVATATDLYILSAFVSADSQNVSLARLIRLLRLGRVLRIFRTMELFQHLRVLLKAIVVSMMSLCWSMVTLFIFMLMGALLLCQLLQSFVADDTEDEVVRDWVSQHYGTSSKALYTVFEATFSGCWPNYARPLVERVSFMYAFFWVAYVTVVIFTLIRIIYALYLKDTLQTAANDADLVVREKMKENQCTVQKLLELFAEADSSGDGFLSRRDFNQLLEYPKVKAWMATLGVEAHDTQTLFEALDDGDDRIYPKEFATGIMQVKGTARAQQMLITARNCNRILKHCEAMRAAVERLEGVCSASRPAPNTARPRVEAAPRLRAL